MGHTRSKALGARRRAVIALLACRTTGQDDTTDPAGAAQDSLQTAPLPGMARSYRGELRSHGWGGEPCDAVDNDGDGEVDEGWAATDHDGVADGIDSGECDGVENNGDGSIDEGLGCVSTQTCAEEHDGPGSHALWLPGVHRDLLFDGPAEFVEDSDGDGVLDTIIE